MVVMCLFTFFVEKPQKFHVDSAEKADRHVYKGKICVQGKDNPAPICPNLCRALDVTKSCSGSVRTTSLSGCN